MKKTMIFAIAMVLASASGAWAQTWNACTGDYAGYCKWGGPTGTGCDQLSIQGTATTAACKTKYDDCVGGSTLYSDAACTEYKAGISPNTEATGCCKWAEDNPDGKCWTLWTAKEATDCGGGSNVFWSGACPDAQGTCPGGSGGGSSSPSGGGDSGCKTVANGGTSLRCCMYENKSNNCWGIDGPDDKDGTTLQTSALCEANSGRVVDDCSDVLTDVEYCNWGPCLNPSASSCGNGGCYMIGPTQDPVEYCTSKSGAIVTACPAGTTPSDPTIPTSSSSGAATTSSSSDGDGENGESSSSSSGSGDNGTQSSSSDNSNSPIMISRSVHSNTLIAMQNAVNLQSTSKATVQIFNLKGNAVRTLSFSQGSYLVPLSGLPKGLYIVKASNASWKQTIKVTVK